MTDRIDKKPESVRLMVVPGALPADRMPDSDPDRFISEGAPLPPDVSAQLALRQYWKQFNGIPPHVRTWLTHTMLYVEKAISFMEQLTEDALTPQMREKLPLLAETLDRIVYDLRSPYLDNMSLSLLGLERLQNQLIRSGSATIVRMNINMTDVNKIDLSGNLGTAFKQAVLEWLQWRFGLERVSVNPEGTSFLIVKEDSSSPSFEYDQFARQIRFRLEQRTMCERYRYSSELLARFVPDAAMFYFTVDAGHLKPRETVREGSRDAIMALHEEILKISERSLRLLAVGGGVLEKTPAELGLESGMRVYDANFLLRPEIQSDEGFERKLELGLGYVPANVYISPAATAGDSGAGIMVRHPRYGHDLGRLDHACRPGDEGGALQRALHALNTAARASTEPEKFAAVRRLRKAAEGLATALELGRRARLNPRNPLLFEKWMQTVHLHDASRIVDSYFIEQMALTRENRVHLAVVEIDSFKAFSSAYPIDETDSSFWGIFDVFADVAELMSMRRPIMSQVAGDLVAVAIPTIDREGVRVDLSTYMNAVQRLVRERYAGRPFHDCAKVKFMSTDGMRVERIPLWAVDEFNAEGRRSEKYMASPCLPSGGRPFMNTVSISWVGTTIHVPRTAKAVGELPKIVDDLATKVEAQKERSVPFKQISLVVPSAISLTPQPPPVLIGGLTPIGMMEPRPALQQLVHLIDQQFAAAWSPQVWDNFDPHVKAQFMNRVSERMHSLPPIVTPEEVGEIFESVDEPAADQVMPEFPTLFIPMLPSAV